MSGDVVLYDELARQDAMMAIEKLGQKFAASGLFGVTKPEQGEVMAMTCLAERMTPVRFSQTYHVVLGKLSMRSDAMLAKYMEIGGKVVWIESSNTAARARWIFNGNDIEIGFTIEDAKKAELAGKDTWKKYPDAMLRARCISKAIRMVAPMVNSGIYTPEEVGDFDDAPKQPMRKLFPKKDREPVEADARVIDDGPPSEHPVSADASGSVTDDGKDDNRDATAVAFANFSLHEDAVNAYLVHLKGISDGQTFRDLAGEWKKRAIGSPSKLIGQAKNFAAKSETKEEVVNV